MTLLTTGIFQFINWPTSNHNYAWAKNRTGGHHDTVLQTRLNVLFLPLYQINVPKCYRGQQAVQGLAEFLRFEILHMHILSNKNGYVYAKFCCWCDSWSCCHRTGLSASDQNYPRNSHSLSSQVIVHIIVDVLVLISAYHVSRSPAMCTKWRSSIRTRKVML